MNLKFKAFITVTSIFVFSVNVHAGEIASGGEVQGGNAGAVLSDGKCELSVQNLYKRVTAGSREMPIIRLEDAKKDPGCRVLSDYSKVEIAYAKLDEKAEQGVAATNASCPGVSDRICKNDRVTLSYGNCGQEAGIVTRLLENNLVEVTYDRPRLSAGRFVTTGVVNVSNLTKKDPEKSAQLVGKHFVNNDFRDKWGTINEVFFHKGTPFFHKGTPITPNWYQVLVTYKDSGSDVMFCHNLKDITVEK